MTTPYQRALGDRFQLLHPTLQRLLGNERGAHASGKLQVHRSSGLLRNIVAWALGIPPAGDYDLLLEVVPLGDGQRWVRRFGKHVLATRQREWRGLLIEFTGPAGIGFELVAKDGALLFRPRRAWLFGTPIPLWLAPHIEADNRPFVSGWRVELRFSVPLLGQVARYEGDVTMSNSNGGG